MLAVKFENYRWILKTRQFWRKLPLDFWSLKSPRSNPNPNSDPNPNPDPNPDSQPNPNLNFSHNQLVIVLIFDKLLYFFAIFFVFQNNNNNKVKNSNFSLVFLLQRLVRADFKKNK